MACYSPLRGFKGAVNENGCRPIVWKAPAGTERQTVPCGKCLDCKLNYSKDWAMRCVHEASRYSENSFVTLTFDEKNLPDSGDLSVRDVQLFMKRLRKKFGPTRYFFAGEYGGKYGRPHYHGLLFGCAFTDRVAFKVTESGETIYTSQILESLWPFGFSSVGDVTFKSASYVARYCVKKVGDTFDYFREEETGTRFQVDKRTGEARVAEFTVMSRRPGIASAWFDEFQSDVYPSDEVIFSGRPHRPPRFYDFLLDKRDPDLLESLKLKRASRVSYAESTDQRLLEKEEFRKCQVQSLKRNLEG